MVVKIRFSLIILLAAVLFTSCKKKPQQFTFISSTPHARWEESSFPVMPDQHEGIPVVNVDVTGLQQDIDGFGACFNELGWDALQLLPDTSREAILKDFFTPEGCDFTICRMPIGANDYSRDWYSLDETDGDFNMNDFSIERDREALIPYIKAAMQYTGDLKIWASPWSPPVWMKTNHHYACRPADVNDLGPEGAGREGVTEFIMEKPYLEAYALYFEKFVNAYRNEGVNLYAVHVQNEPNSCQSFPSCVWAPSDQATFIGDYLGPKFKADNVDAQIWYGTYERPSVANVDTILQDPEAGPFVTGVGFQWAGKEAIAGVHEKYPDMKLMQTESECGNGSNDWKAAEYTWSLMKHYLENGASSYLYWNMALDETGKSRWGWKQNSLVTVDSKTRKFKYNPEYYLFKALTHTVKPGAIKLKTPAEYDDMMVFLNPGNELAGIIVNTTFKNEVQQVKIGDRYLVIRLQPKSFNAFTVRL
ncbi:MAG TPA: beta-glycosidase [Bacteroidales bacterium]|nr:beta-glycosidase [Bacteroidales bacterium]